MKAQLARKILRTLSSFIVILNLCSCFDIGDYEDEAAYCAAFTKAYFVCQSDTIYPKIPEYDMDALFNIDTANNLTKVVDEDTYKYIVIKAEKDIYVEDSVIWMYSTNFSGEIKGEMYVENSFPTSWSGMSKMGKEAGRYEATKARIYHGEKQVDTYYANFSGFGEVDDGEGHSSTYETTLTTEGLEIRYILSYESAGEEVEYLYVCKFPIEKLTINYDKFSCIQYDNKTNTELTSYNFYYKGEYGDIPEGNLTNKVGAFSLTLEREMWNSFIISSYTVDGNETSQLKIKEGDYIFFKILNNSPYAYRKNLSTVSFSANNIILRGVEEEKK